VASIRRLGSFERIWGSFERIWGSFEKRLDSLMDEALLRAETVLLKELYPFSHTSPIHSLKRALSILRRAPYSLNY